MAANTLRLPDDAPNTGEYIASETYTHAGQTANAEHAVLVDPSGNVLISATTTPGGSDRGLVVRNIPSGTQAVSGTVTANEAADVTATGLMDALNEDVTLTVPAGCNVVGLLLTGTVGANSVFTVEGTVDGSTWEGLTTQATQSSQAAITATISGGSVLFGQNQYVFSSAGMTQVRVKLTTFTAADSITATLRGQIGDGAVWVMNASAASGDVGHDSVNSTNVLQIGGQASETKPTAVTTGDRVRGWYGVSGGQMTHSQPPRREMYQAVTAEVAPAITIGVKELFNLFHPSAVTVDAYITEIIVSCLVTTASTTGGRTNAEVLRTSTVGTGGTNLTPANIGGGSVSAVVTNAAANVMTAKTGGGTLGDALVRQGVEHATQPLGSQRFVLWEASSLEDAICLRGGVGSGINVQVNRVAAHTALVDQWTCSVRWIEL